MSAQPTDANNAAIMKRHEELFGPHINLGWPPPLLIGSDVSALTTADDAATAFGEGSELFRAARAFGLPGETASEVRRREEAESVRAQRACVITDLLTSGKWEGRKSIGRLARRWSVSRVVVREAAELAAATMLAANKPIVIQDVS